MAGHSKWAQIKRSKAVKDAKKGATFAQCSREIIMAAKLGGGDPEGNFRLRTAITRAKAEGMPNDNIKRAIEKGTGALGGDAMEDMTYEGYGPGGVAIFIEAMTDNRNRTAGDIRSYFNKYNGNLGADGCVAWIFEAKGLIRIPQDGLSEDAAFEKALEAGAMDFAANPDEGAYDIFTDPVELNSVASALNAAGMTVQSAEATRIPQNSVAVDSEEVAKPLFKLLDAIESHDDVQSVYANFDIDEALLAQMENARGVVVQEWSGIAQKRTAPHDNGAAGADSSIMDNPSDKPVHSKLSTAHLHRFFREISANARHAVMLGGSAEPSPLNRWVIIGLHARQSLIQEDAMLTLNGERMPATSEALWQALESVRASCQNWENAVIARPHRQACPCEGRGDNLPEDADKPEEPSSTAGLPMTGGLITAFGYDFARWCDPGWQPEGKHTASSQPAPCHPCEGRGPRSEYASPEMLAFEFEDWIIVDLEAESPTPVILSDSSERKAHYEAAWQACMANPVDACLRRHDNLSHSPLAEGRETLDTYLKTFTPSLDQAAFEQAVERIQDDIRRGEIYQANLSLRLEKALTLDPLALFETLCTRNPSPFSAYLHWPDSTGKRCAIVSNSPERLVSVDAGGKAQVRPIAGTRGRGQSAGEDAAIGDILRANPKERAEHMMLVDLARNDLGRVCAAGSVSVDELLVLERYSHVTHLVSNVRGDLSPDCTGFDLLRAVFPGGTITGCPKLRCMEILDAVEPVSRGFYTGSLGWMDVASPALDLNILIRSVFLREADTPSPASRQHIHVNAANATGLRYNAAVHVGAGIVHDAVPAHEYRECLRKATATLAALQELESHPHPSPPPSRERGTVTGNAYAYAESK